MNTDKTYTAAQRDGHDALRVTTYRLVLGYLVQSAHDRLFGVLMGTMAKDLGISRVSAYRYVRTLAMLGLARRDDQVLPHGAHTYLPTDYGIAVLERAERDEALTGDDAVITLDLRDGVLVNNVPFGEWT